MKDHNGSSSIFCLGKVVATISFSVESYYCLGASLKAILRPISLPQHVRNKKAGLPKMSSVPTDVETG